MSAIAVEQQTMRAIRFYQPGDIRLETIPKPTPGVGELVIRIGAALTCGTDLKTYRRGHPVLLKQSPSPFGHEGAGTVSAVGEGVTQFAVGDRVVAANSAPCQTCFFCRKHQPNLCRELDLLNGTYAEYLAIPARIVAQNTLHVPDCLPDELAAFTEPLAVCLRGIDACNIQPGDTVGILGIGSIGLLMARLAKQRGATVVAFGRNPMKRRLAETFAMADTVVNLTEKCDVAQIRETLTPEGLGFDVVVEAVGLPELWEAAIALVRRGGRVNLFGGCAAGTHIQLDTRRLHYDEITLMSLFHHTPQAIRGALAMLSAGTLDPTPLITQRRPLEKLTEALDAMQRGEAIKIALFPEVS